MSDKVDPKFRLTNVRLSYPNLFRAREFKPGDEPSFGASFLMDKAADADQILAVRQKITEVANEFWNGKIPTGIKLCLRKGDEQGKEEVEGYGAEVMFVSSNSKKRPIVVGRNRAPLTEADGVVYAGCYVNASVRFWAQDNKWGKRINAQLLAVQFALPGEAFGEAPVDVDQEFEQLEEDSTGDMLGGSSDAGSEGGGLLG